MKTIVIHWVWYDGFILPLFNLEDNMIRKHKCYVIKPIVVMDKQLAIAIHNLCKPINTIN